MTDRRTLIGKLDAGDIFHAESPNGASFICLVLSVDEHVIHARRVTTQQKLTFDRRTGKAEVGKERIPCIMDSVAPLPPEIHQAILQLDEKNRSLMAMDEKSRFADLERLKLTDTASKALVFVGTHYPSHPLPPLQ